jgi:hypothetical protein
MVAMRTFMLAAVATALLAAPGGSTATRLVEPGRSFVGQASVGALALSGRSVAVAVGETAERCPRVQLWLTSSNRLHEFRSTIRDCKWGPSTGVGLTSVAVAGTRALWITYGGGNTREWLLWTGTTTTAPKRLRLVRQDADSSDPPPIVLGPGTTRGLAYAVGSRIVYLGANGTRIFRTTVASPVRALAAGPGPKGLEVAALLADGWVIGFDGAGREYTAEPHPPGAVTAVRVAGSGVAVQVGNEIEITPPRSHDTTRVRLPAAATMLDVAQHRVLYSLEGDLWTARIGTGARARLVDGTRAKPAYGQIDRRGLAWARGRTVAWRAGALP